MTQERLAERAGIEERFVQMIESATANPTLEVMMDVADALAVPLHKLLVPARLPPARRGRPPGKAASKAASR